MNNDANTTRKPPCHKKLYLVVLIKWSFINSTDPEKVLNKINQSWPNHSMPQLGSFSHFWCQRPNTQQKLPTFPDFLDQVEHNDTFDETPWALSSWGSWCDTYPTQCTKISVKIPKKTCHTRAANFDPPTKMGTLPGTNGAIPTPRLSRWFSTHPWSTLVHLLLVSFTKFIQSQSLRKIHGSGWHLDSSKWVAETVGFCLLFHFLGFACSFFELPWKSFDIKTTKTIR